MWMGKHFVLCRRTTRERTAIPLSSQRFHSGAALGYRDGLEGLFLEGFFKDIGSFVHLPARNSAHALYTAVELLSLAGSPAFGSALLPDRPLFTQRRFSSGAGTEMEAIDRRRAQQAGDESGRRQRFQRACRSSRRPHTSESRCADL